MRAAVMMVAWLLASAAAAQPLLLISIDGLRPGDVIDAEQRGLKLPNLRKFLTQGAFAVGVKGVLPTVTYPSHVELLTGVSPAKHGIVSNTTFDPTQINYGGWYWYASDIRVPTLWSAVANAGKTVGNVHWPVSVGATGVTWNLPQIWRSGHPDDAKLVKALATPNLIAELEQGVGVPYAAGIDESIEGDENRARFTIKLIESHKPVFLTAYFTALDHEQHAVGPGTPAAHAVLERIDLIVGKVAAAEMAAFPDSVVAVVSDHGFETIKRETSFFRAFIDAGLIKLNAAGAVESWDAMPWPSGGSVAVILARKGDASLLERTGNLLDGMKADPANGISDIADSAGIARMGGNPDASFFVNMAPDASAAGFAGASAPRLGTPKYKGTHGYFPNVENLRSTFLIMGKGIPKGRPLGVIDMRAIAPTLAKLLDVPLPDAELPAIDLR